MSQGLQKSFLASLFWAKENQAEGDSLERELLEMSPNKLATKPALSNKHYSLLCTLQGVLL